MLFVWIGSKIVEFFGRMFNVALHDRGCCGIFHCGFEPRSPILATAGALRAREVSMLLELGMKIANVFPFESSKTSYRKDIEITVATVGAKNTFA